MKAMKGSSPPAVKGNLKKIRNQAAGSDTCSDFIVTDKSSLVVLSSKRHSNLRFSSRELKCMRDARNGVAYAVDIWMIDPH